MFQTDKIMFYHIARTGGIYVKYALRKGGVKIRRSERKKNYKNPFSLHREHETPAGIAEYEKKGQLSFCFVRKPVSWIKSFWSYRVKTGFLDPKFPLDRIWDDNFEKFCQNILEKYPNGFVTQLFQYYVNDVDIVGKYENLTNDLVDILKKAGQEFNEKKLRSLGRMNSASSIEAFKKLCLINSKLENKLNDADSWVLDTYYKI